VRDEILELLVELSAERVVLVVTHEPELFSGLIAPEQAWTLQQGILRPALQPV
jgi:energy-coupling factor transport system ATP-binding protein